MKKSSKAWLTVAAFLILTGVLLSVGVLAMSHWDLTALSTTKLETKTFEITDAFQSISIRSDTEDLRFLPSEDGNCRVEFVVREKLIPSATVKDGMLSIEVIDKRSWRDAVMFSFGPFEHPGITVYLPKREYASLFIDEDTGDISLPSDFSFDSIRLSVSTGKVDCRASASGLIGVESDTGDILLEGISAGELSFTTSTGRIELRSITCAGDLSVTVNTGKATLTDVSCGSFTSKGGTGDLVLEQLIAAELISVERDTGDVRLEDCDARELLITTDTGDVSGTLLSEKVFIVRSDTGSIRVPETTSGGKCKITTDTGNITIKIR